MPLPSVNLPLASPFAAEVFERIFFRLASRADDVAHFTATGFSFEEWIEAEALLTAARREGWKATPRTPYANLGQRNSQHFADLVVHDVKEDRHVVCEIDLVHDYSGEKVSERLEQDRVKLSQALSPNVEPLHVIVLASAADVDVEESWQRWLPKVTSWNRPDPMELRCRLPPRGTLVTRGWTIGSLADVTDPAPQQR